MNEHNDDPKSDLEEGQLEEFSEEQLKEAIQQVEQMDLALPLKNLILQCLKCVSTLNSVLSRKKMTIWRLRRLFGIKTEKKSPQAVSRIPRRQRLLRLLARKATAAAPTKTTQGQNKS